MTPSQRPAPPSSGQRPFGLARPGMVLTLSIAVATVAFNALILVIFHDQFWWPPDDGVYAHLADRLRNGEVLHRDVQSYSLGYVAFANAAALEWFGHSLVSMRYPLVLLGIAQSGIVFALLARFGRLPAVAGATLVTALGFVQFLNPSANWYALFLAILLSGVLEFTPARTWWRVDVIGAVIVTAFLFRPLSGIFIAMGGLTWLLLQGGEGDRAGPRRGGRRVLLARALVLVMLAGLVGYLHLATNAIGWLLFGIWPLLMLLWTAHSTQLSNRDAGAMILRLARGGAIAATPLVAYHAAHASFGAAFQDTVVDVLGFGTLPYAASHDYGMLLAGAVEGIATGGWIGAVNGVFWIFGLFAAAITAGLLLSWLVRSARSGAPVPALPVIAVFYALVSLLYQIPIYLTFTSGLSIVALLAVTRGARGLALGGFVVAAVAVYFHAGQPLSRGIGGIITGTRIPVSAASEVPRTGVRIEPGDAATYAELVATIERETTGDATIFAVPNNAELYFLARRRNPFRFFNTLPGVRTQADLEAVLATLEREPPALVIHDRNDKNNSPASREIMERIEATYERLPAIGGFELYRAKSDDADATRPAGMSRSGDAK